MLAIQKFLYNTPNGIEELKKQFAIDSRRHPKYSNLVLFKYNQIESDFSNPIVQEARGIILDENSNWDVVFMGLTKFFNLNEPLAAPIDWSTAVVQEKLDGSFIGLYWYDNHWDCCTTGSPDAGGEVNGYGFSFSQLFWGIVRPDLNDPFLEFTKQESHMFELCTPYNRVVVNHKEKRVVYLGSRSTRTLKECPSAFFDDFDKKGIPFEIPVTYKISNVDDCIEAAKKLDPMNNEGFVVVDANYNRVKIKSPAYVILHHAKDSLSKRKMCDVIRKGEYEEFKVAISSFPELNELFEKIKVIHDATCYTADEYYSRFKDIEDQKEFAKWAKGADNGNYASLLFTMRKTGKTADQCLKSSKLTLDSYMNMIGANDGN